ncbi:MAG: hypothetical protein ABI181_08140 [Mycobacteriaceae bacterium]
MLDGGVETMLELARSNLRNIPRPSQLGRRPDPRRRDPAATTLRCPV